MPIYTTLEAIERRLKGYAKTTGIATAFESDPVDPALVAQVVSQVEARVAQALAQRFQMPLVGQHEIVASAVEKLVVCELLGQLYAGQEPSERGGYASLMCQQGKDELKALQNALLPGEELLLGSSLTVSAPAVGVRSLPGIYNPPPTTRKIDPIKW